jgi:hypothetical protein
VEYGLFAACPKTLLPVNKTNEKQKKTLLLTDIV